MVGLQHTLKLFKFFLNAIIAQKRINTLAEANQCYKSNGNIDGYLGQIGGQSGDDGCIHNTPPREDFESK